MHRNFFADDIDPLVERQRSTIPSLEAKGWAESRLTINGRSKVV